MTIMEKLNELSPVLLLAGLGLVLVWLVLSQVLWLRQRTRLKKMFRGRSGEDLERVILDHENQLRELRDRAEETASQIVQLNRLLARTLSRFHLVRFNPYGAGGAEQSFSVAMLDDTGDGVVLSCLQSGEGGTRIYGKAIEKKTSDVRLSPEEENAIDQAMKIEK